MRRFKTLTPAPGEELYTWSDMACEPPFPPRWTHNGELLEWEFVGYQPYTASNLKTYFFEAIGRYKSDKSRVMLDVQQAAERGDHDDAAIAYRIAQSMPEDD